MLLGERMPQERNLPGERNFKFQNLKHNNGNRDTETPWITIGRDARGKRLFIPDKGIARLHFTERETRTTSSSSVDMVRRGLKEQFVRRPPNSPEEQRPSIATIFVLYLPEMASTRDIWDFFGYNSHIKDIILPKKRDINGNRFSFIQTYDFSFAIFLTNLCNGTKFMRNKLLLKVNHLQRRSIVPGSKNVNPRNESTHSTQVRYPHPPPPQKNKHSPENLVQQPSHRTISLDLPIDVAQEINRSLIGITIHDQWADIL